MIESVNVGDFKAVPHLATSLLMSKHAKGVQFSTTKPNVIVGPNGSGKSALLTALSLYTLSYFTGQSSLDRHYVAGLDADSFWGEPEKWWMKDALFLQGLNVKGCADPAFYYRPGHIPGNDDSINASMMCGYFDEAKAFGHLVENKSSGQQCAALLEKILATLNGSVEPPAYGSVNWGYAKDPVASISQPNRCDYRAQRLVDQACAAKGSDTSIILMDEPEQSLDALAELKLWKAIEKADVSKMQVIVATHSLYPLLHPESFNLIESVSGYAASVTQLLTK